MKLFPLDRVRLLDGPFHQAQETDRAHLLAHDVDRLLAPYRRDAALPAKAKPYGNWESMGLDGHAAGHYLSAISMMFAATGDAECKRRVDYMIAELAACQTASGDGYVGGVPQSRELWTAVAEGKFDAGTFSLSNRWVPWYNLHKIFAGVRDAYLFGQNEHAKAVLIGMTDWCAALASHLSDESMQAMLQTEHGGMNEVLADASVISGDARYLTLAKRFNDRKILDPLLAGHDQLTGLHANTQIPKVIGFAKIAMLTDDRELLAAARFFWDRVTGSRSVSIGGNSTNEHFNPTDDFTAMLEDRTGPETCNTYNMLRLTELLFQANPHAKFADFYERALFNHILSTQHPTRGGFVYFTPMRPRHYRVYSQAGQCFWCCVGTGFENHAKYGRFIYAQEDDELFVNQFIASELDWPERGVTVRQETTFPDSPRTRLVVKTAKPSRWTVAVRRPAWVAGEFKITVNGDAVSTTEASGYARITREWQDGDTVEIDLPMQLAAEELPDKSPQVSVRYGPIVLAMAAGDEPTPGLFAGEGRGDHIANGPLLPRQAAPMLVADDLGCVTGAIRPVTGKSLTFTATALFEPERWKTAELVPFFRLHETRYAIYFRRVASGDYPALQKKLEADERERLALDAATLDVVTAGEQQSEIDHGYAGEQSTTGYQHSRSFRMATGWFSYQMKSAVVAADLLVTWSELPKSLPILTANGQALTAAKPQPSADEQITIHRYALPPGGPCVIKIAAAVNSSTGNLSEMRIIRR